MTKNHISRFLVLTFINCRASCTQGFDDWTGERKDHPEEKNRKPTTSQMKFHTFNDQRISNKPEIPFHVASRHCQSSLVKQ